MLVPTALEESFETILDIASLSLDDKKIREYLGSELNCTESELKILYHRIEAQLVPMQHGKLPEGKATVTVRAAYVKCPFCGFKMIRDGEQALVIGSKRVCKTCTRISTVQDVDTSRFIGV